MAMVSPNGTKLKVAHHKSPINEYDYLAVDDGSREPPVVCLYEGRLCYVSGTARVRVKKGRAFYNAVVVRFLDDGSAQAMGSAAFGKKAKAAPIPAGAE
jgi:hypothetical protein